MHKRNTQKKHSGHLVLQEKKKKSVNVFCNCSVSCFHSKVIAIHSPIKGLVKNFGKAYYAVLFTILTTFYIPCQEIQLFLPEKGD